MAESGVRQAHIPVIVRRISSAEESGTIRATSNGGAEPLAGPLGALVLAEPAATETARGSSATAE